MKTHNHGTHLYFNKYYLTLFLILILGLLSFYPSISTAEEWTYTTRPDDTLWDISKKYLKSVTYWERLQQHNNVDIAKYLAPGTRLRIPLEWLKIQAAPAMVVNVTGKVEFINASNKASTILTSKQTISIGDEIITDSNSSALLQFADGSTLLVQKNSQVIFNTLSSYEHTGMVDTRLRLQQGRVETSVKPMRDSSSRYEITTPAAVAAVRGTQFRVAYENQQSSMASEVVEGSVNVAALGIEQSVDKGFGTITEKGKPPQVPVKLLEKPDLGKLAKKIRYLPFTIDWPPLNDAQQYRIQVSTIQQADSIQIEDTNKTSTYTFNTLSDGEYILRIRGIDKSGLEGFNAEHKFEINTNFPVATPVSPVKNISLGVKLLTLEWSKENNVFQYHLQISTDIEFKNIIIDQYENNHVITLKDKLTPDQYYWRVTAIDNTGNKGKHSAIEQFTINDNRYESLLLLLYFLPAFLL